MSSAYLALAGLWASGSRKAGRATDQTAAPGLPGGGPWVRASARMSLGRGLCPHPAHCGSRHPLSAPLPSTPPLPSLRSRHKQSIQPTRSQAFKALLGEDLREDDAQPLPSQVHHTDRHVTERALPAGSGGRGAQRRARLALAGRASEPAACGAASRAGTMGRARQANGAARAKAWGCQTAAPFRDLGTAQIRGRRGTWGSKGSQTDRGQG